MASYVNLFVDQGSDFETDVTVSDSANDPIDLNEIDLAGQVRRTYTSETAYDFVVTKVDADNGEIKIALPDSTTSVMKPGRYVYDVFATDTLSGIDFKVIEGILEIVPSVTR